MMIATGTNSHVKESGDAALTSVVVSSQSAVMDDCSMWSLVRDRESADISTPALPVVTSGLATDTLISGL